MSNGAAIASAVRAFGTIVQVEPNDFMAILAKSKTPLVVQAQGGVFTTKYSYLTSHKGLTFYTKVSTPLNLPGDLELVIAKRNWMPG